ncbi:MAG TPA: hypothetical protein VK804_13930 [Bradyrhizobium sp.]|jgi:hypothetical protein|uniref:hypothetical protein n=1 Tax=Bradyrhizobium sp. TaxID=376 RepID=UPI002B59426F|nr:hypothetical protein [Bradyrhizobium sp.]HTB01568.1 hypothetical protein [Bradyrhizobium sp.]
MAQILLRSDTKLTEFGHLTPIDIELNGVILELFYLLCLDKAYDSKAAHYYLYDYDSKVERISYQNPFDILALFKNIPKHCASFILDRTVFYTEEKQRRQAEADKKKAEVEEKHQSVIQKKLANLDKAHKLRQKMIKDGIKAEEATQLVGGLLFDQRAKLLLVDQDKASA